MYSLFLLTVFGGVMWQVGAHTVITYPGWRGNNLIANGTLPEYDASALGENYVDGQYTFPYGMQWIYPCGGMPTSTNRSLWPVTGGALSVQPGWLPGHKAANFYINIGITEPGQLAPPNMSHNVVPAFQVAGPTNEQYNGTFCLPQVPLPANVSLAIGDNITIQVIELAQHGAAIYNCADVTLADPVDVPLVNSSNCFNSSDLSFKLVFTTASLSGAAPVVAQPTTVLAVAMLAILLAFGVW